MDMSVTKEQFHSALKTVVDDHRILYNTAYVLH